MNESSWSRTNYYTPIYQLHITKYIIINFYMVLKIYIFNTYRCPHITLCSVAAHFNFYLPSFKMLLT